MADQVGGPVLALEPDAAGPQGLAGPRGLAPLGRTLIAGIMPMVAAVWILLRWRTLEQGIDQLARAHPGWLVLALLAALPTWLAGAASLQGAVAPRLPVGPMLAVQVAGSVANQLLPAGFGVGAVKLRFLRRHGLPMRDAVAAVGLDATAGMITHLAVLLLLVAGGYLQLSGPPSGTAGTVALIAAIAVGALLIVLSAPPARRAVHRLRARLREQLRMLADVVRVPSRAALLWGGSAAIPLLHAATLWFVARALHLPMGGGAVVAVYFAASAASALVPSPGGFGSLDTALTAALVAAGQSASAAVAAVLGYRLITVWLPLAPSACVLATLVRRGHL